MKKMILILLMTLGQIAFAGTLDKAATVEAPPVLVASPWYPVLTCNDGELSVQIRNLVPEWHRGTARQDHRLVLRGKLAADAVSIDGRLKDLTNADNSLTAALVDYGAVAKISLCAEGSNCSQGPNFNIELGKEMANGIHPLKFFITNTGGSGNSQVGETVQVNCKY